jgi:hypothetical protein
MILGKPIYIEDNKIFQFYIERSFGMKWFLIAIMFIHGLIHMIGGVTQLEITTVQGFSGRTLIFLSNNMRTLLGILWFITVVIFLIAALGYSLDRQWWRTAAIGAVIISQLLVFIWWPDAKWGTVANFIILSGIIMTKTY